MLVFSVDRPIGVSGAVHAKPTKRQGVGFREAADAHQRGGHGNLRGLGEGHQLSGRSAGDDAAPTVEHRPLGLGDEANDFVERQFVGRLVGVVAPKNDFRGPYRLGLGLLDVLWDVDDHRAGPAGLGDVERFLDHPRDVVHVGDQIGMLHDGQGDADDVGFLKGAPANHVLVHLAGEGDERAGIHVGVGDGRVQISGAGTGGSHAHARPAGGTRVTFGGKTAALLMAGEDGSDL